jgi:hypothetical protein
MKLRCISSYRGTVDHLNGVEGEIRAGEEIDVSEDIAAFLRRSSPGSFAAEGPAPVTDDSPVDTAPNRMQKGGRSR